MMLSVLLERDLRGMDARIVGPNVAHAVLVVDRKRRILLCRFDAKRALKLGFC